MDARRKSGGSTRTRGVATFTRYRTNIRPVEKFDRTFCSHGTVQYFHSVHTETTNHDEF